jgi:hypothetical protein
MRDNNENIINMYYEFMINIMRIIHKEAVIIEWHLINTINHTGP